MNAKEPQPPPSGDWKYDRVLPPPPPPKKLMDHSGHPMSRDYYYESQIECHCTTCVLNQNSQCVMPSRIKINAGGVCEMSQKTLEDKPKRPRKPTPPPPPPKK